MLCSIALVFILAIASRNCTGFCISAPARSCHPTSGIVGSSLAARLLQCTHAWIGENYTQVPRHGPVGSRVRVLKLLALHHESSCPKSRRSGPITSRARAAHCMVLTEPADVGPCRARPSVLVRNGHGIPERVRFKTRSARGTGQES